MQPSIKINKAITQWEWFNDGNTLKLWLYLLINAQFADAKYMGIELKKGQYLASQRKLAEHLDVSVNTIIRSLTLLKESGSILIDNLNSKHGSIITVVNYDSYLNYSYTVSSADAVTDTVADTERPTVSVSDTPTVSKIETRNINNNIIPPPPPPPTHEGGENWRVGLVEGYMADENWIAYKSQEVMLPPETVRNALESFKYQLITSKDISSTNETELVMHITNWLRKHKRIKEEQELKNKQLNNGFRTNNPCGTPSADVSTTGGPVGGTTTTNYPVGGTGNSYPVVGGTDNSTDNTATILGGLPANNPLFRHLAEYRRKAGI